jgi:hypothetical protein
MKKLKKNQLENLEHLIYLMRRANLLESEKTAIDYLDWFTDYECAHYGLCLDQIKEFVLGHMIRERKESKQ